MSEWMIPGTMGFLESIGFRFGLDWDGQLEIAYPEGVTGKSIADELAKYGEDISAVVSRWSANQRRQCVGGPYNGRPHTGFEGERVPIHIRRGRWAVYVVGGDGRAWFRGYATSRAKAKRLKLVDTNQGRANREEGESE